jgi:YD repeat-containing protein
MTDSSTRPYRSKETLMYFRSQRLFSQFSQSYILVKAALTRAQLIVFNCLLLVFALGLVSPVRAQNQDGQSGLRGFQPNGSVALSDIESVGLSSGNLNYSLPVASLPPSRGGRLKPAVFLHYNSKLFDTQVRMCLGPSCTFTYVQTDLVNSAFGGWTYGTNFFVLTRNRAVNYVDGAPPPWNTNKYQTELYFPDGSSRQLRPSNQAPTDEFYSVSPGSLGTTRTYYTTDGSYIRVEFSADGASWTIYFPDGNTVNYDNSTGIQRTTDGNGNFYTTQNVTLQNGNPATVVTDQLNRKITVEKPVSGPHYVRVKGFGGTEVVTAINWATRTVQGKKWLWKEFVNDGIYVFKTSVPARPVVTSIDLPNGLSYQFQYNSEIFDPLNPTKSVGWGELHRVTLPSGATAQYAYSMDNRHGNETDDVIEPKYALWNHPTSKQVTYTDTHDGVNTQRTDTWGYGISVVGGGPAEGQTASASMSSPDGGVTSEYFFVNSTGSTTFGRAGISYKTVRPDGSRIERFWQDNIPHNGSGKTKNAYVKTEFISIPNSVGTLVQTAIKDYLYDKNGNVTQIAEYDWVAYGDIARDVDGNPTGAIPASAQLKRVTAIGFYNQTPGADSGAFNASIYNLTSAPSLRQALQWRETRSNFSQASAVSRVEFDYDDPGSRGNLTAQRSWDSSKAAYSNPLTSNNSISASTQYNQYGSPTLNTDARLVQTQVIYDAIGGFIDLYPTQVKTAFQTTVQRTETREYDFSTGVVTKVTDVDNNVFTSTAYDVLGRPTLVKVAEGKPEETRTSIEYSDAARRVITRSDLNTVGDGKLVGIEHYDQLGRLRLKRELEDSTTQSTTDETTGLKVQIRYLFSGSNAYVLTSNPYRAATSSAASGENTMGWTRTKRDNAGRVIESQTFGGTTLPLPWGSSTTSTGTVITIYDANSTTVTDQAGKVRRSVVDGLGRLTRVDEPDANGNLGTTNAPVQPTNHTYDPLGDLTTVAQGSQLRTFVYNSLSRLTQATNPESGSVNYQYDDSGNLLVKTDARTDPNDSNKKVSTHYQYDSLNRVTRRWYNGSNSVSATTHNSPSLPINVGSTDEVKFYYDNQTLPGGAPSYSRGSAVGRLVAQTYGTGTNGDYFAYDELGRPIGKFQQTGTKNYYISATYMLSGAVATLTYPSNRTVNNVYDQAGRLTSFSGNLGDGTTRTYSAGALYSSTGGLVKEQFGTATPIYNKLFYNSRGQLAEIRASTSYTGPTDYTADRGAIVNNYSNNCTGICSGSSMADNNGNLQKQEIHIPSQTMRYQVYDYDSLNRLSSVREVLSGGAEQWKQAFTYDRWGNRTINTGITYGTGINNKAFNVNATSNRLEVPAGPGVMTYDAAGNLTNDTYTGAGNRTYDAENKITSAWGGNNQAQLYGYDASGQRIKRTVDGVETWQVYGFGGELLAEYPGEAEAVRPQKEYGYRNGQLLITFRAEKKLCLDGKWRYCQRLLSSQYELSSVQHQQWRSPWSELEQRRWLERWHSQHTPRLAANRFQRQQDYRRNQRHHASGQSGYTC